MYIRLHSLNQSSTLKTQACTAPYLYGAGPAPCLYGGGPAPCLYGAGPAPCLDRAGPAECSRAPAPLDARHVKHARRGPAPA